ncbi:MAG TPA: hypothetical protein VNJ08_08565 [Bacteriovoracaceae bacterium]|nr:hypothetical protein [Bacteriovoracaceae bacterium]
MKTYVLFLLFSITAWAGPREQAFKLHNRLTGVPPKPDVLLVMEDHIRSGEPERAAEVAVQDPRFYNIVLKNWIKPWTNRERTNRVELNDYVATVLGVIRDDIPFDRILYDDIIYTVNDTTAPAYSNTSNAHYSNVESRNVDLEANLIGQTQSTLTGLPATSGVITTRAAGAAFYSAGTNRRINRFTFINYLCKDYEDLHDITIPDYRVRRDVERNPGGDSRTYKNKCVGCHAGQDALAGAFAHYDFVDNGLVYTPLKVVTKMNHNNYYPEGFVTSTDSWINTWATGQNAVLGWRGATQGNGVKSLYQMFAKSKAFSQCMSKKVFELVCLKEAINPDDKAAVETNAAAFEKDNQYNLKKLIVRTSARCVTNE